MTKRKKMLTITFSLYCGLWAVTALVGIPSVDNAFDRQFSEGFSLMAQEEHGPVIRIEHMGNPKDLRDGSNNDLPDKPWRYRSRGIAVAPFVIIDEAAWVTAPLGGGAGRRIVFWFFGLQGWIPLKWYWSV